jgi:hypothetical protein
MKRKTFSIAFFIKKSKLLRNGKAPVLMRITIDGVRADVSLKRSIDPERWNTAKGSAKPLSEDERKLNRYLDKQKHKVYCLFHSKTIPPFHSKSIPL